MNETTAFLVFTVGLILIGTVLKKKGKGSSRRTYDSTFDSTDD